MLISEPPQTTRYFGFGRAAGTGGRERSSESSVVENEGKTLKCPAGLPKKTKQNLCSVMKGTRRPRDETVCAPVALEMKWEHRCALQHYAVYRSYDAPKTRIISRIA